MPMSFFPTRTLGLIGLLALLQACASGRQLGEQREELGDFFLSHAVVVADTATVGPASRRVEAEEWEQTLITEMRRRFDRYEGDRLYHLGVSVDGYILAIPGIPLVAAPRSALILGVTVWDDAAGEKINERPHRITVLESLSGETVIGSGLTQSAEEQMRNLSENAVAAIERWLASNPEWFDPDRDRAPLPEDAGEGRAIDLSALAPAE